MDKVRLAETLREIRSEKGVSLRQAARDVDVDVAYLSRVERGDTRPSTEVLNRLSGYYDISPDALLLEAGRVPQDILTILQENPEASADLRRRYGAAP